MPLFFLSVSFPAEITFHLQLIAIILLQLIFTEVCMTCAHIETTFRVTDNIELQILIIKVIVYGIVLKLN